MTSNESTEDSEREDLWPLIDPDYTCTGMVERTVEDAEDSDSSAARSDR